jgi:hypothetical protein
MEPYGAHDCTVCSGTLGSVRIYCLFFIAMLIYACISLRWVKDLGQSVVSLYLQTIGIAAVLLIAAAIKERNSLYRFLDVLTVCYIIIIIIGIYEIFTGHFLFSPLNPELRFKNLHHLFFPYTVFGNTNDFATYVTFSACGYRFIGYYTPYPRLADMGLMVCLSQNILP